MKGIIVMARHRFINLPREVQMALFIGGFVGLGFLLIGYGMPMNTAFLPAYGAVFGTMLARNAGSAGMYIMAGVLGLVSVVVAIVAWTPQVEAIDQYAFIFKQHCLVGNEQLLRVFNGAGTSGDGVLDFSNRGTVTLTATTCTLADASAVTATATTKWFAGSGELLSAGSAAPTATIAAMLPITTQYAGISLMIIGVMPILNTAAFLGVTGANIFMLVRGVDGVQTVIVGTILALILSIVAMNFGPTVITQMDGIHTTVTVGRFFSIEMFAKIIELITEFFPTVYTVGLLAIVGTAWSRHGCDLRPSPWPDGRRRRRPDVVDRLTDRVSAAGHRGGGSADRGGLGVGGGPLRDPGRRRLLRSRGPPPDVRLGGGHRLRAGAR